MPPPIATEHLNTERKANAREVVRSDGVQNLAVNRNRATIKPEASMRRWLEAGTLSRIPCDDAGIRDWDWRLSP